MTSRLLSALARWIPRRERHYVCFGLWRIYYKVGPWTVWISSELVDCKDNRWRFPRRAERGKATK